MHEVATETLEQLLKDEYPDGNHGYSEEEYHAAAKLHLPVVVAKVDCVQHKDFCASQGIHAYPTLRLFVDGKVAGNYMMDRTIQTFTNFLSTVEQDYLKRAGAVTTADEAAIRRLPEALQQQIGFTNRRHVRSDWKEENHPGCQLSGFLMVDRTPGNFQIKARSKSHDLVASMTNVSHEIHLLSVGDPSLIRMIERNRVTAPANLKEKLQPMNGNVYVTNEPHTAYHHHLKMVTTNYKYKNYQLGERIGTSYQLLAQSQLSRYETDEVPEAKFSYDLSPVAISYRETSRKWYDYVTSIMAIIGGSFTVVGMMESTVHSITSKKRR